MLDEDAERLAGEWHARDADKRGYRCGLTSERLEVPGGNIELERPRGRAKTAGKELPLPSWAEAMATGWLGQWTGRPSAASS